MSNLHVMKIEGSGYANLKVVDVTLARGVNKIGGDNRQGKSSLMALIEMFQGKAYMPALPKTLDARKGAFEVSIGDDDRNVVYTVKYSFTAKDSYITVVDSDGESVGLQVLKDLLSPCLNPWEFYENATATGKSAKERRREAIEVIKPLMVFEFDGEGYLSEIGFTKDAHAVSLLSQHDGDPLGFLKAMDEYVMEKRKTWKAKLSQWEGTAKTLEAEVPVTSREAETVDVSDLLAEQATIQEQAMDSVRLVQEGENMESEVLQLEANLIAARAKLEAFRRENETLDSSIHVNEQLVVIQEKIAAVGEDNKIAQKAGELRELQGKLDDGDKRIEIQTTLLDALRDKKTELLESAQMPIDGLTIEGDVIMKNGIPLGQDSTEEGLTDAFKIGLAKFSSLDEDEDRLTTLLIPNASLMGKKASERMYELAEEHGIQLILELVLDERQNGVIFVEDGVAKSDETVPAVEQVEDKVEG